MSWTCPKCERELLRESQRHWCAKVSLEELFKETPAEIVLLFDKILVEVADWDNVIISTTPNCVVFLHRHTFPVIKPKKKELDLKFYTKEALQGDLITKSVLSAKKYENHIRLLSLTQLNPLLFTYLRDSYNLL